MTERTLQRALESLAPVQHKLVVVGGTAHSLFPQHELGHDPGFDLLTTEDVDLAAPLELGRDSSRDLLERLESAGFTEDVRGAEEPAYRYVLSGGGGSYLQFIAPRTGDGSTRSGDGDRRLKFSGINAEKLSHVGILLHSPWVASAEVNGLTLEFPVVNPVAFLVQKLLTLQSRDRKRAKDLLYIFDTISVFAETLGELAARAGELVQPPSRRAQRNIRRAAQELCFRESDVSRGAAAIAAVQRVSAPSSSQLVGACELGLRAVLADLVLDL